ncbi:MAG TPA: ABC transporter permease subunit, partial [Solirubrobacteraceae bacterium]|nr:ABC transporter permease subunit [Solirubrobacteraceae bacterium]
LAIFGLALFARPALAFLSQTSAGGSVFGKSFLNAGMIMSLIALPLVVTTTREALMQIPAHVREASYALGKTKATTIRRVLLPSIGPSISSGVTLGIGRIVGDTAIVVFLLGATTRIEGAGGVPVLSTLRGTGETLTSYVLLNSPAGEGNAHEKAYAAAFVLLLMVLALNVIVMRFSSKSAEGKSRRRTIATRLPWAR